MTTTDMQPPSRLSGLRLPDWPRLMRRRTARAGGAVDTVPSMTSLRPQIDIPLRDPDPASRDRQAHLDRGRHLARQDAWDQLAEDIRAAESSRRLDAGLTPVAALLSQGARADAVEAAQAAIARGDTMAARSVMAALSTIREDFPDDPAIAHVVAMAHVDLACTWAARRAVADLPPACREAHDRALQVTAELADRFDPFAHDSPLWAMARCAVLPCDPRPATRVADDYEDLIELDPGAPGHMMALGRDLLPDRFGTVSRLEEAARRIATLTAAEWGAGGYVFTLMGALEQDATALRRVDGDLFAEGLHDICARRRGDAHLANRLAAFCGVTMASQAMIGPARDRIAHCFAWIAADHLTELHPSVWAAAPVPGDEPLPASDMVRRGKSRAHSAIAHHFAPQIGAGQRLVFTAAGLQVCTAS